MGCAVISQSSVSSARPEQIQFRLIDAGLDIQNTEYRVEQIVMADRLVGGLTQAAQIQLALGREAIGYPLHHGNMGLSLRSKGVGGAVQVEVVLTQ